jgi:3-dehydroquinate dehydratase/shikimate dehydrogenase
MICISIAQKSRRFALVDLFNAAPQCDLVEVRLDCFDQAANIAELLTHKRKPLILTCRRAEDGGEWMGQEEERLALLRQCVVSKADYVEIELDVADKIRPLPPTKRVISYTNLVEVPDNLKEIYQQALTKNPDVIKLVVPARSPEEVWPVVQVLAKPAAPTVVVGVGKPGIMLALLARKVGAPWVYAALERGMEAYHEQFTVRELEAVYYYYSIDRSTPFVAVTGFGELQYATVALLNAAFARLGQPDRCLPLEIGNSSLFRKVLDVVKAKGAVIDAAHQPAVRDVVDELKPSARQAEAVDFITHQDGKWQGHHVLGRALLAALEETVGAGKAAEAGEAGKPEGGPLRGRVVVFVGARGLARVLAAGAQRAGAVPIIASNDREAAQKLAQALGCRFIREEAVYTTLHDVLVRCEDTALHPSYLKPGMTVVDATALPRESDLLAEARQRGCQVVSPQQLLVELVSRYLRAITGATVPREFLLDVLRPLTED